MRAELTCQVRKFSSIDAMIDAAQIALEKFVEHSEKENSGAISLMESQAHEYLKLYVKIASDIANFIHPRRKAIEYVPVNATADMTSQQKLEAAKAIVCLLEQQVKETNGPE